MKFTAKKKVTVEEEIEVDDRIYQEDEKVWKIANIILEGALNRIIKDLYHDDVWVVTNAAERINNAFKFADKIMELDNNG